MLKCGKGGEREYNEGRTKGLYKGAKSRSICLDQRVPRRW